MQRRGSRKEFSRTPSLPKSEPPVNDPPYEVIEFSNQQYSNTASIFANKTGQKDEPRRKCDLCGSSNAQYHCELCVQQAFCVSCDQMYHRHPKRQTHVRKRLPVPREKVVGPPIPPIPPKGELTLAPIPPPRRNKRGKNVTEVGSQETVKKNGSIMGSLKRFVGGIQPSASPFQPKPFRNDTRPPKFSHSLHSAEFDQQSLRRDSGYLGWELNNRHRSGSFAALNGSGFTPLMQAQSMAQLNCPSCHHHGMPPWDWNRSQMNLNAFPQPWPGMSTGTWHGSIMFPPPYKMAENFSDQSSRRGSVRQKYNRRPSKYDDDSESDLSLSDDRKSRRRSPTMRTASPALSRRSRRTMISDTEDETVSRKSDRRFKRRTIPVSREPSPAMFRRIRKKFDDDAISVKSTSSRKSRKSPVKPSTGAFLRKNIQHSSSDSDDELTSERDAKGDHNTSNSTDDVEEKSTLNKVSDVAQVAVSQKSTQVAEKIKNYEKMQSSGDIKSQHPKSQIKKASSVDDWECEHCTYLNTSSSRVCDVCCKSKKSNKQEESLVESMKNLKVSLGGDDGEKKKGDQIDNDATINNISTGTSLPPQSAATQTYDVANVVTKRNRSLSFDDHEWNPSKKSSRAASETSDNPSMSNEQQSSHSPDRASVLLQKQLRDGLEIVKLLQDAEKHQFNADDLTVALMHCGETNPIKWLLDNWNKMIDTVVTLATNYGHEQAENIIGTISSFEAQAALHLHNGDIWAAATDCIRQRQRKYMKLMSKGNFTREDVVTVLTANHGDIEAAFMELRKSQLKPFLMKIWGPPQGLDNESGNTFRLQDKDKYYSLRNKQKRQQTLDTYKYQPTNDNFNNVQSWLKSVHPSYQEDIDLSDFMKLKNELKQHTSGFYLNYDSLLSTGSVTSDYSNSNVEQYSPPSSNTFLRYRSYENLNRIEKPKVNLFPKRFHKSSESLFYKKTKSEYSDHGKFFVQDLNYRKQNLLSNDFAINVDDPDVFSEEITNDELLRKKTNLVMESTQNTHAHSSSTNNYNEITKFNYEKSISLNITTDSEKIDDVIETDSLNEVDSLSDESNEEIREFSNDRINNIVDEFKIIPAAINENRQLEIENEDEKESNFCLFKELKALYLLAKINSEFLIISNNELSIDNSIFPHEKHIQFLHVTDEKLASFRDNTSQSEKIIVDEDVKPFTNFNFNEIVTEPIQNLSDGLIDGKIYPEVSNESGDYSLDENVLFNKSTGFSSKNESIVRNESSEEENDYTENIFHDALAENINENVYDEEVKQIKEITNTTMDMIPNKLEKIQPVSFTTWTKPAHVIRINVSDDVVNASKKNVNGVIFSSSSEENTADVDINHSFEEKSSLGEKKYLITKEKNDIEITENSERNLPGNISVGSRIADVENNFIEAENEGMDFENKLPERYSTQTELEEKNYGSHTLSNESFSEYIREVIVLEDIQSSVKSDHEEKSSSTRQSNDNLYDGYLSDSSDYNFQVEVQNCLSQGISNYDQAVLAAQLIKLKFDRSQSIDAALECSSIQAAITYLQQDCLLCTEKVSIKEMISMLECEHRCCQKCAEQFFSLQILEKNIIDCVCPFCKQPEILHLNSDQMMLYFSNLDILLKSILPPNIHELFQQKLRDRTLMLDSNFKWCTKCSSGFIAEPGQTRILCPDCKSISCAQCGKLWDKEHDGKTCEQYNSWVIKNDPNSQLVRYLEDYGVTCPKCDTKFILVKGGCMHLTCSHCKYEFCSDCLKEFSMGAHCKVSEYCSKLGLHAHHPRNCLFYLRDKEPQELKQLLKNNNVPLNLEPAENQRCNVQLQRETEEGLVDTRCGARVEEAGFCRNHLREYLSRIICRLKLETIDLLTCDDLETVITREGKKRPPRGYSTPESEYYKALYQLVKEEMPIE